MKLGQKIKHHLRHIITELLIKTAELSRNNRPQKPQSQSLKLVLLISRPQDIDLYIDVYQQSLSLSTISVSFWATRRAMEHFPSTRELMAQHKINVNFIVSHHNLGTAIRRLKNVDALLSTVESSFAAHEVPHRLTRIANACGCITFTVQHGPTYSEPEFGSEVTFAAQNILIWNRSDDLPGNAAGQILDTVLDKWHAASTNNR